ncbi:30S ribosomal protein S4 [endosymbiont 'TC1' of Trimyema compressum]|uniref:30S ribosomal protein S4 n=1 Tax=endosymbiont 'TC1' of Trimyema compressum TaxID=243899 RepID=UPI0007F16A28|nr:30S ribosomal protein S4 [endosymbiont 'TC1' of Trimyema compressum]AMP20346.1 30S ribosomal protein S4 [endosymbiont 'TC1' of Trimyema compressum]
MARYKGTACRLCRREGTKLYLKSDRCYSNQCAMERRGYPPGQHGQGRKKVTEYGLQLRAKQTVKRIYGVLEKQFRGYFKEADRQNGITGDNLLVLLERRLDNVAFRLGLAKTRTEARQLVRHGHFLLNGKKINIPSYLVRVGDEISVREKSRSSVAFKELSDNVTAPSWLTVKSGELVGKVELLPTREEISIPVDEQLIVELYSR